MQKATKPPLTAVVLCLLLQACSSGSDPAPANSAPELAVAFPTSGTVTDQSKVVVRGSVSDADGEAVSEVTITNASGQTLTSVVSTEGMWSAEVTLDAGTNTFNLEARDARGLAGQTTLTIGQDVAPDSLSQPVYAASQNAVYAIDGPVAALGTVAPIDPDIIFDPSIGGGFPPPFDLDDALLVALPIFPGPDFPIIEIDLDTGSRRTLSGAGVGAGPELTLPRRMAVVPDTGDLVVHDASLRAFVRVDRATGDRTLLTELGEISPLSPKGMVVDAGRQRLLATFGFEVWAFDLDTGEASQLATVSALNPGDSSSQVGHGLALSPDGTRLYVFVTLSSVVTPSKLVEIDLVTLTQREISVNFPIVLADGPFVPPPPDDLVLDEASGRVNLLYSAAVVTVDIAAGTTEVVAERDPGDSIGASILAGRNPSEVFAVDFGVDELVALSLASGEATVLSALSRGTGPRLNGPDLSFALSTFAVSNDASIAWAIRNPLAFLSSNTDDALELFTIDLATGDRTITSIAGEVVDGPLFSSPVAVAPYGDGTLLSLTDSAGFVLQQIDAATGTATTVFAETDPPVSGIGSVAAPLLCTDEAGDQAFLARWRASDLQRVDLPSGAVSVHSSFEEAAGAGPALEGIRALACDPQNQRVVAMTGASLVAIDYLTGDRTVLSEIDAADAAVPFALGSVALSGNGEIAYVIGLDPVGITVVDLATGDRQPLLADSTERGFQPISLRLIDDETALARTVSNTLWMVDLTTGSRVIVAR